MSTIAIKTGKDFDYLDFISSIRTNPFGPTNKIKYFDDKIVIKGDDGCSVEFYGDKLKPNKGTGFITEGVFKIDGVVVAEISDVRGDISTIAWKAALLTKGYAPVSYVLGVNKIKDNSDEEFSFLGGKGDDTIIGEGDADNFLFGGKGHDLFLTSAGGDTYFDGGQGFDAVDYETAGSKVALVVSLADPSKNKGAAAGDTYNSIEDVTGSFYADKLIGDEEANVLNGSKGSDTLIGGGGRDTLDGGAKDANSFDFVSFEDMPGSGGGRGYYVDLAKGIALGGDVTNAAKAIKILNIEGVIGSDFNDLLVGDQGTNTLYGEDGADTLVGGRGSDILRGDEKAFGFSDADMFQYTNVADGGDTILDYDIYDQIGISRNGFDLSDAFVVVDGVSFIKAANATAVNGGPTFLFDTKTSKLFFDADGTGAAKAKLLATITFDNPDSIDARDFILLP